MLEQGTITIHTQNIFPIIKKSLYSDHEVFFRELVSNGVDAIQKLKMVGYAGETELGDFQPEINITIDKEKRTLSITDNGIGMTADEVKKYINQVAFSSAEEFIQKYQGGDQPLIGHFGLGFYSAFMVAQQVEIDTLSYKKDAEAVHWTCSGSPEFSLASSERSERGTTVILTLLEGEEEYLDPQRIRQLVKKYCDFMPVPIKLDGEIINRQKAIWRESASNLTAEDYQEFYRYLYPFQEEPLLWVHLQTDYPFLLNGILYFPKLQPDIDVTRSQIKLFCNQVYVSDHCEEIIPRFLLPMRGVIDSPDIPLNVSRSALQMDRTVRRIGDFIAKKVGDRLQELHQFRRTPKMPNLILEMPQPPIAQPRHIRCHIIRVGKNQPWHDGRFPQSGLARPGIQQGKNPPNRVLVAMVGGTGHVQFSINNFVANPLVIGQGFHIPHRPPEPMIG